MSDKQVVAASNDPRKISLDTWAVLIALAAAALIRFGWFPSVPW